MTSQRTRLRMVERLREQGIRDEAVLAAMAALPRHVFVEEALASRAYEDIALPLGFGQTISQPYTVARMTRAARARARARTRCSRSAPAAATRRRCSRGSRSEVYSIERIAALLEKARRQPARRCGIANVRLLHGDGHRRPAAKSRRSTRSSSPAAATHVPEALLEQLARAGAW